MRVVLVGPPGSGKGTQAAKLCERLGLTCIGTGKLLRDAIRLGTPVGRSYEAEYALGRLAPDAVVNELVAELFHIRRPEKFAADGYPRTYSQAIAFDALLHQEYLKLDAVIHLTLPDAEVVRRIGARRVCPNPQCAAVYGVPKSAGVCDRCTTPLARRDDDHEASLRHRLEGFHRHTDAVIEHYRKARLVRDVPAVGDEEAVYEAIAKRLM